MNTNDKELLERAAKAARYDVRWEEDDFGDYTPRFRFVMYVDNCPYGEWNPLVNDAAALQLAMRLDIAVIPNTSNACTDVWLKNQPDDVVISEEHNGDKYAAARRAIVRGAVEVGKINEWIRHEYAALQELDNE